MNTKITFIILFLGFFINYFAQEITLPGYPSAKDVLPSVVFRISEDSSAFIYFYNVKNRTGAQQAIWKYMVQIQTVHFSINIPSGWRGSNISRDTIHAVTWHSLDSLNDIHEDSIQDGFNIISEALPNIAHFYAKGWIVIPEGEEVIKPGTNDVFYNSFKGITIGPVDPPDPFIHIEFIETLISYTDSSYALGWIQNQETRDKYNTYFNSARSYLEQGDSSAARSTLENVLQEVDIDSTDNLTSEAYALLRYNTEYLIEKIPLQSELNLDVINPSMSMKNPGTFTMDIEGSGFSSNSVVYFNGQVRATTLASDDTINAEILASDVSEVGNFPVWVSDGTTNSDTLMFAVVNSLPKEILPIMNCVTNNGNGTYTAYFGYNNKNSVSVYVPVYSQNKISPEPWDRGQPGVFKVGVWERVFSVTWTSGNIIWHLNNNTAKARTNSPPCQ